MTVKVAAEVGSALVAFRSKDGSEATESLRIVDTDALFDAAPYRAFRWFPGQHHYSGAFWSSTVRGLIPYESRLELSRLMLADFDRTVKRIVAQPFQLRQQIRGTEVSHVPDFLLGRDDAILVVDVKASWRLTDPLVIRTQLDSVLD